MENNIIGEEICTKYRSVLNKLTPENFRIVSEQVKSLEINTECELRQLFDLIVYKAINEPNCTVACAELCKQLTMLTVTSQNNSSDQVTFKKLLITQCQKQFETKDYQSVKDVLDELETSEDPLWKKKLEVRLEIEKRKVRMQSVGNIKFIGELYKLDMLAPKIMHYCMNYLLVDQENELQVECLCELLNTIGAHFEQDGSDRINTIQILNDVFNQMQNIVDRKDNNKISRRVRFMLQDVIELRRKWSARNKESARNEQAARHKRSAKDGKVARNKGSARNEEVPKTRGVVQKKAGLPHQNSELINVALMGAQSEEDRESLNEDNSKHEDDQRDKPKLASTHRNDLEDVKPSTSVVEEIIDLKDYAKQNYIRFYNKNNKLPLCELCNVHVPDNIKNITEHVNGGTHKKMKLEKEKDISKNATEDESVLPKTILPGEYVKRDVVVDIIARLLNMLISIIFSLAHELYICFYVPFMNITQGIISQFPQTLTKATENQKDEEHNGKQPSNQKSKEDLNSVVSNETLTDNNPKVGDDQPKSCKDVCNSKTKPSTEANVDLKGYVKLDHIQFNKEIKQAFCELCNVFISGNIENVIEHASAGTHEQMKLKKPREVSEKKTVNKSALYKTISHKEYCKYIEVVVNQGNGATAMLLNRKFFIAHDSFLLLKKINPGCYHHCEACKKIFLDEEVAIHLFTCLNKEYVYSPIVDMESEFIRELKPGTLLHCGFCNEYFSSWTLLQQHSETPLHRVSRELSESIARDIIMNNRKQDKL